MLDNLRHRNYDDFQGDKDAVITYLLDLLESYDDVVLALADDSGYSNLELFNEE